MRDDQLDGLNDRQTVVDSFCFVGRGALLCWRQAGKWEVIAGDMGSVLGRRGVLGGGETIAALGEECWDDGETIAALGEECWGDGETSAALG